MRLEGLRHVAGQLPRHPHDRKANALLSDFVARKIRQRVKDPTVAEKLIPTNHGFGTRRVPLETKYYEVYNQPNVSLVAVAWSFTRSRILRATKSERAALALRSVRMSRKLPCHMPKPFEP